MALGVAHAGFEHAGLVEWNSSACDTLRANVGRVSLMRNWMVHEGDVRAFNFAAHAQSIDLLAAGAPCQPFSLAGKHRGDEDTRNMFPEVFRAASTLQPRAIIVENVKGLLRPSFREYFEYILRSWRSPHLPRGIQAIGAATEPDSTNCKLDRPLEHCAIASSFSWSTLPTWASSSIGNGCSLWRSAMTSTLNGQGCFRLTARTLCSTNSMSAATTGPSTD